MDELIVAGLVVALLGFFAGRAFAGKDTVSRKHANVAVLNAYLKGIDFAMSAVDKFGAAAVGTVDEEYRVVARVRSAVEKSGDL